MLLDAYEILFIFWKNSTVINLAIFVAAFFTVSLTDINKKPSMLLLINKSEIKALLSFLKCKIASVSNEQYLNSYPTKNS